MKKNYVLGMFALAALTMVGCSNDEVVNDYSQDNAIQFGTYMGRDVQGRGEILTTDNLADFGVFAAYTGQTNWTVQTPLNFMFNQEVTKPTSGDKWTYAPLKYWPTTKNDKISFFAYAPYAGKENGAVSVITENSASGTPQIKYTIKSEYLTEAEDFVADVLVDEVREGDGNSIDSGDRNVTFNLQHELTRVNIQAKLDRDAFGEAAANKTKVNITSIKFGGTQFALDATYTFGTTDNARGTWTLGTTSSTLDIANLLNTAVASGLGGYTTKGILVPTTALVSLFKNSAYLFLIPTGGETGVATEGDVTVTVAYDIVTADASLKDGYSKTSAIKTFKLPAGALKQGVAYNYIFTFGLNEIALSASVGDWTEDTYYDDIDWTLEDVIEVNE